MAGQGEGSFGTNTETNRRILMAKIDLGGNTTDPEVKLLMEKYTEIKPGDVLSHADLALIAGAVPRTARYYTVVNRFRKRMFDDKNFLLSAQRSIGYVVQSADEQVDTGTGKARQGLRFIKVGGKVINKTLATKASDLTAAKLREAENASRLLDHIVQVGRKAMEEIKLPDNQARLPTRAMPAC
jgi:hypothetical protein